MIKKYPSKANNIGIGNRPWKIKNDLIGKKFGKLSPVKIVGIVKRGSIWECRCDCGKTKNILRTGLTSGHINSCGCLVSDVKKNENNPMWKGKKAGYGSIHTWVRARLEKPNICPICKKKPPIDLSNIGHTYRRNLKDWVWLCRKCHIISDGRMDKLIKRMKKRRTIPEFKICLNCNKKYNPSFKKQKGCSLECSNNLRIKAYVETRKMQRMQN